MWYRFALDITEITPEHISRMRELNKSVHPDLIKAKHEYLDAISKLNPVDHPSELDEHWENFRKVLKRYTHLPSDSENVFETWRAQHPNEVVESAYEEYKPGEIKKEWSPEKERDFEKYKASRLDSIARRQFRELSDAETIEKQFGLSVNESNPHKKYNRLRNEWAEALARNYSQQIPVGTQTSPTVTIVIGFPGAGKNSYIKPDPSDQNSVKKTPLGLMIDPDETQRDIIGYMAGMGSSETIAYANKIKLLLLEDALQKKNDVVIPMGGAKPNLIINEIVNHVIHGRKVKVVLIPTDAHTAHQRVIERARKDNERLIKPTTGDGDPNVAFVQAKNIIENPDFNGTGDMFVKKLVSKKLEQKSGPGERISDSKIKNVPLEEKQAMYQGVINLISFELAQ